MPRHFLVKRHKHCPAFSYRDPALDGPDGDTEKHMWDGEGVGEYVAYGSPDSGYAASPNSLYLSREKENMAANENSSRNINKLNNNSVHHHASTTRPDSYISNHQFRVDNNKQTIGSGSTVIYEPLDAPIDLSMPSRRRTPESDFEKPPHLQLGYLRDVSPQREGRDRCEDTCNSAYLSQDSVRSLPVLLCPRTVSPYILHADCPQLYSLNHQHPHPHPHPHGHTSPPPLEQRSASPYPHPDPPYPHPASPYHPQLALPHQSDPPMELPPRPGVQTLASPSRKRLMSDSLDVQDLSRSAPPLKSIGNSIPTLRTPHPKEAAALVSKTTGAPGKKQQPSSSGRRLKAVRKLNFDIDTTSPVSGTIIKEAADFHPEEGHVVYGDIEPSYNLVEVTPEARAELEKIENKIGDYVCQLCKELYGDAFQLAQHRCSRIVHVEYRCPECEKVFNCPANLASHRRWHKPRVSSQTKLTLTGSKLEPAGYKIAPRPEVKSLSDIQTRPDSADSQDSRLPAAGQVPAGSSREDNAQCETALPVQILEVKDFHQGKVKGEPPTITFLSSEQIPDKCLPEPESFKSEPESETDVSAYVTEQEVTSRVSHPLYTVNLISRGSPAVTSTIDGLTPGTLGNSLTPGTLGNSLTPGTLGNSLTPGTLGNSLTPGTLGNSLTPGTLGSSLTPEERSLVLHVLNAHSRQQQTTTITATSTIMTPSVSESRGDSQRPEQLSHESSSVRAGSDAKAATVSSPVQGLTAGRLYTDAALTQLPVSQQLPVIHQLPVSHQHPVSQQLPVSQQVECSICGKRFQRQAYLRKHLQSQHGPPAQNTLGHPTENQTGHLIENQTGHLIENQTDHPIKTKNDHLTDNQIDHSIENQTGHLTKTKTGHPTKNQSGQAELVPENKAAISRRTGVTCSICCKTFPSDTSRVKHEASTHGLHLQFSCSTCGTAFSSKAAADRHSRSTHSSETFSCKYCTSMFHSSPGLTRHINKCHPTENRQVILLQLPSSSRTC